MLTQVDEREPQRHRIAPAHGTGDRTHLRQQAGTHERRGEVQRRHGSQRVSSQNIVEVGPAFSPEQFSVLDHHPAQCGGTVGVKATQARGVPGRSGRDDPVAGGPEVEHRVHARGGPLEPIGPAQPHQKDTAVGDQEPGPVAPHERSLQTVDLSRPRQAVLQAQRRGKPKSDGPVGGDRIVDPRPRGERPRIGVGQLVGRKVGPHVQRQQSQVPAARARRGHRERRRRDRRRRHHPSGRQLHAAPEQRRGDPGRDQRPGSDSDGPADTQGAASIGAPRTGPGIAPARLRSASWQMSQPRSGRRQRATKG